jgi:SSS family solute:Na+ symporter
MPALGLDPGGRRGAVLMIVAIGFLMTIFPLIGGTEGAIWTGVLQSLILVAGLAVCLGVALRRMPGGLDGFFQLGRDNGKFSLGRWQGGSAGSSIILVALYGVVEHLKNLGINQTYVQLYATARRDRDARMAVWLGVALYVPLAALTFLMGTVLFAFYHAQPGLMPTGLESRAVFPHLIATQLGPGLTGLVLAALCAAASDSNFNGIATLVNCDLYKRHLRPGAGDQECLRLMRFITFGCGVATILIAIGLLTTRRPILMVWWQLAGICSGGMLGLFLLALWSKTTNRAAMGGVIAGTATILILTAWVNRWISPLAPPIHGNWIPVLGTAVVLVVGGLLSIWPAAGTLSLPEES